MGETNKMLARLMIAALVVASMAMRPKPIGASSKESYLILSEKRKTGAEGATIQVNCSVRAPRPPAVLKWELSKDDKPNVEEVRLSNTTVALHISSLKRTNAGQYTCLLVMPDGMEEKEDFDLFVEQGKAEVCSQFQFKCKKTKTCLFLRFRCDNMDDCKDGSDEECDVDPCLNKFRCNNSRCVEFKYLCDHIDQCGDRSDEHQNCNNGRTKPTSTAQPVSDDSQYAWLQITVSTFIVVTVGLVFLISFIVIMVFRIRMRRLREQRIARALQQMYHPDVHLNRIGGSPGGGSGEPTASSPGQTSDQQQFLLGPSQTHYGNIIVNVNNGVQYIPGYDYALMMDVPPPYSEVGGGDGGDPNLSPPPYSTLEHQGTIGNSNTLTGQGGASQAGSQSDPVPPRGPHPGGRCATVHAGDVGANAEAAGAHPQRSTPLRSGASPSRNNQTLPGANGNTQTIPSININSDFLQSLLGSHTRPEEGRSGSTPTPASAAGKGTGDSPHTTTTARAMQDSHVDIDIVPLTASPRHRGGQQGQSSPSSTQGVVTSRSTSPALETHTGDPETADGHTADLTSSASPAFLVQPGITAGGAGVSQDRMYEDPSEDECRRSLLSAEEFNGDNALNAQEEEDISSCQTEDSTFLLRKPKHKTGQEKSKVEPNIVVPSPSHQGKSLEGASNALLNEVSKRDSKLKPKPGHLSVRGGEILLHTSTGVLVDPPKAPPTSEAPTASVDQDSPGPELAIENGALVFGTPKRAAVPSQQNPCHVDPSPHNLPADAAACPPNPTESSSQRQTAPHSPGTAAGAHPPAADTGEKSDTLRRRELQFKDGELVLESPKHTPSAQILSHLKGAYAEEDGMAEAIEPVVNTKRTPGPVVAKPQIPKFNSDVVIPPKIHPQ